MRDEAEQEQDLHGAPGRLLNVLAIVYLNVLAIVYIAVDMERQQRAKPQPRADHGTTLVIQMNNCCCRKIIALVPCISNSLTVISIDMVEHAIVEASNFVDDLTGHHLRGAGNVAGEERFGHVAIEVQQTLPRIRVVWKHPSNDGTTSE